MANLVPLILKPDITAAHKQKFASEEDFLLMLYSEASMGRGFRGVGSVCCKVTQQEVASCEKEGGCVESEEHCLLFKMKQLWSEAAIPMKSDFNILRILKRTKEKFDQKNKNKRLSAENRQTFVDSLRETTVNLAKADYEKLIRADPLLSQTMHLEKIALVKDYIGPNATRSALVEAEHEMIRLRRVQLAQRGKEQGAGISRISQMGDLPEESTEAGRASRRDDTQGGSSGLDRGNGGDGDDGDGEDTGPGSQDTEGSGFEEHLENMRKRQRRCDRKRGLDVEEDYVQARMPKDLLYKTATLASKLGISLRTHLSMIMATYELCGVDSTQMELSLSSALRHRRSQEKQVANEVLEQLSTVVKERRSKICVHFDTKHIKQDINGVVESVERLVIAVSSPVLERDQLLTAFPLETGTGEAMAEAVFDILVSLDLHEYVMAIVADTTATNFGQYRGAIALLQDFLGYPVLVIPCLHHVEELPPKHVMRLVSGRRTTGPGESIFLIYHSNFNEIRPLITNTVVLKTFDWEEHCWLENGD